MVPTLKTTYDDEIRPKLMADGGFDNVMAVPRLVKINVNMGVGAASQDIKELDSQRSRNSPWSRARSR